MAELILTEEEKALPYWNDLDDADLGKAIKRYGIEFISHPRTNDDNADAGMDMTMKAGTIAFCCRAHEMGVKKMEFICEGVTLAGKPIGNWRCTYELIEDAGE
jgi:hypothetical protein